MACHSAHHLFGTPNPYGNNGDCTWTYDNSTAGFKFHFSQLSTEADYDYVYVKDAAGTILATYHGDATVAGPITSPVHRDLDRIGAVHLRRRGRGAGIHRGRRGALLGQSVVR